MPPLTITDPFGVLLPGWLPDAAGLIAVTGKKTDHPLLQEPHDTDLPDWWDKSKMADYPMISAQLKKHPIPTPGPKGKVPFKGQICKPFF
ncbi:hypothetical protein GMLC_34650 [Geomonas limicola]|uniref:Uncharacterized protein n=1 Tax=Geomonas limicola TaxID=2740186 RepID=A0A6V8NBJ5_9BACT|nr:hypothetical protein GMLC_34650 [Geomonas limicola]